MDIGIVLFLIAVAIAIGLVFLKALEGVVYDKARQAFRDEFNHITKEETEKKVKQKQLP